MKLDSAFSFICELFQQLFWLKIMKHEHISFVNCSKNAVNDCKLFHGLQMKNDIKKTCFVVSET